MTPRARGRPGARSPARAGAVAAVAWLVLVAWPECAHAQFGQPSPPRQSPWGITLGVHALTAEFQPNANGPYSYAARGWGFALAGGFSYRGHVLVGGEGGVAMFGADREYPPTAEFIDGAETTHALVGALYVGVVSSAIPIAREGTRKAWVGVLAGRSNWTGSRRLEPCFSCDSVAMRMRAGPYLEPFVLVGVGDARQATGFRLAYRHQIADYAAMHGTVTVGLHVALFRL